MFVFGVSSTELWFGVSETEMEGAGLILGSIMGVGTAATGSASCEESAISGVKFAVSGLEFTISDLAFVESSMEFSAANTEFVVIGTEFAILDSATGGDCRFASSGFDDGGNEASFSVAVETVSSDFDRILIGLYTYGCTHNVNCTYRTTTKITYVVKYIHKCYILSIKVTWNILCGN